MALTSHAPLIAAYGQNGFEEFVINFADELLHSYVVRNAFEDNVGYNAHVTGDGVALPAISTISNAGSGRWKLIGRCQWMVMTRALCLTMLQLNTRTMRA
jgi:hypothetical protein